MKTSNKILLIIFSTILILTFFMILVMVFFINNTQLIKIKKNPLKIAKKEFIVKDFNSLKLEGSWKVKIVRSDNFTLSVKAPEEIINNIKINIFNKNLEIKQEYIFLKDPSIAELSIFMPNLTKIISRGVNNIIFLGFKEDQIDFEAKGFNTIKGKDSNIKNIKLSGSTIKVDYDFNSCNVENAYLALAGFGTTTLNMNGGNLEGRISGSAIVNYRGNISKMNVDVLEEAQINKR